MKVPQTPGRIKLMSKKTAIAAGYSADKRKRRREHRRIARELIRSGTFLNSRARPGTVSFSVAQWHIAQARLIR